MNRQEMYRAWWAFYAPLSRADRQSQGKRHIDLLRGKLKAIGAHPGRSRSYDQGSRQLVQALGMALGVHQQLVGGLTASLAGGLKWKGGGRDSDKIGRGAATT